MRVLVVGGAGYLGSALVPALLSAGHDVVVVDAFWFGDFLPPPSPSFEKIPGLAQDLITESFLRVRRIEAIIFLAGLSNDPMAEYDPMGNFQANAALPAFLAHIASRADVERFIHGSSCSVYGRIKGIADESTPPQTQSPYGLSKLMAEQGVRNSGVPITLNIRMGTVCGVSPRMRFDLLLNSMVRTALTSKKIIVNDPTAERPVLDIIDAIRTYLAALEWSNRDKHHLTYNAYSRNLNIREAASFVRHVIPNAEIEVRNIHDPRSYKVLSINSREFPLLAKAELLRTIESIYDKARFIKEDLFSPKFSNIETFKQLGLKGGLTVSVNQTDSSLQPVA